MFLYDLNNIKIQHPQLLNFEKNYDENSKMAVLLPPPSSSFFLLLFLLPSSHSLFLLPPPSSSLYSSPPLFSSSSPSSLLFLLLPHNSSSTHQLRWGRKQPYQTRPAIRSRLHCRCLEGATVRVSSITASRCRPLFRAQCCPPRRHSSSQRRPTERTPPPPPPSRAHPSSPCIKRCPSQKLKKLGMRKRHRDTQRPNPNCSYCVSLIGLGDLGHEILYSATSLKGNQINFRFIEVFIRGVTYVSSTV